MLTFCQNLPALFLSPDPAAPVAQEVEDDENAEDDNEAEENALLPSSASKGKKGAKAGSSKPQADARTKAPKKPVAKVGSQAGLVNTTLQTTDRSHSL